MDRTAWIAVTLCTAGLMAWFWYAPKNQPRPAAGPEIVQAAPGAAPAAAAAAVETPAVSAAPLVPEETMSISNDGIAYVFSNIGGGIKTTTLPPQRFSGKSTTALNTDGVAAVGALALTPGLIESEAYELKSSQGQTPVIYERTTPEGLVIRKTWTPVPDGPGAGFLWRLALSFRNAGPGAHTGAWSLYAGTASPIQSNEEPVSFCWNADGEPDQENAKWFEGSRFLGFREPAATFERSFGQILWGGVHSQYYTTLIAHTIPERELPPGRLWAQRKPVTITPDNGSPYSSFAVFAAFGLPDLALAPGQEKAFELDVYTGPRAHSLLAKLPRRFDDAMFYGWFGFISKPMLWLLTWFQKLMSFTTSSWGWAVILLTILVRGLLWPLNLKATRQMKRMALLAPQMKELQEKYKDEPQKMNAQVMGLYKKFGVNPVSGCLPVVLQIPIFFGLYTMLRFAVELRGHGFLWVNDLALPDTQFHIAGFPINPLPLVMAATMYIQMAMTPKSPDPNMQMQQRIFMFMPFFFLIFCYNFAAALALYWTVSNIIGIFQSWVVKRMPEPALVEKSATGLPASGDAPAKPANARRKPGFMEIFAERLAEQQKKAAARSLPGASPASKTARPGGSAKSALRKPGDS